MDSILDRFEESLVTASRVLASDPTVATTTTRFRRRTSVVRRFRSLGLVAQFTAVIVALGCGGGVAFGAYALLAGGPAQELPAFECQMSPRIDSIIPAVTGSPIVDCAGQWPAASGGEQAAPPLAIWGADNGQRVTAVVAPVSAGMPAGSAHFKWERLPDSWTVDLAPVILTDQLSNIDEPFAESPIARCSYLSTDIANVRSLLAADGLSNWQVTTNASSGQLSSDCLAVAAIVHGAGRTVQLVQLGQLSPAASSQPQTTGSSTTSGPVASSGVTQTTSAVAGGTGSTTTSPSEPATGAPVAAVAADRELEGLYTTVNATLDSTCETVAAASAMWTQAATADGFAPTTLEFWHEANSGQLSSRQLAHQYTLYQQPASQHTGNCAHVLVMPLGGGQMNVYVARFAP